jgi:predicted choloylglycine hydrolase
MVDERSVLKKLIESRKVWLALFGLVQTILFQLFPAFPPAVWQAIDGLVVVLIVSIAAEDAAAKSAG